MNAPARTAPVVTPPTAQGQSLRRGLGSASSPPAETFSAGADSEPTEGSALFALSDPEQDSRRTKAARPDARRLPQRLRLTPIELPAPQEATLSSTVPLKGMRAENRQEHSDGRRGRADEHEPRQKLRLVPVLGLLDFRDF